MSVTTGPVKETKKNRVGTGEPGPGRPRGSQNKFTAHAKEAFQLAFDELGGVQGLVKWAKKDENLGDFYKLYARLIPVEMTGKDGKDLIPAALMDPLEICRELAFTLELAKRPPQPATKH